MSHDPKEYATELLKKVFRVAMPYLNVDAEVEKIVECIIGAAVLEMQKEQGR